MQSDLRLILEVVGGIVLLVTVVWSISTFIDKRIEKKIKDETFIKKLAAATRPALIINGENSIVHDHGALDLLESITVHRGSTEGLPEKIVVVPKRPLAYQPLVVPLDPETIVVEARQGEGLSWVFTLDYVASLEPPESHRRFRVELLL
jgi:hypothetical protein